MKDQDRPQQEAAEADNQRPSNRPSHTAYSVREGKEEQVYFNRVGAAFPHKDGKGLNIELDATPVNGKLVLRTVQERLDDKRSGKEAQGQTRAQDERGHGE